MPPSCYCGKDIQVGDTVVRIGESRAKVIKNKQYTVTYIDHNRINCTLNILEVPTSFPAWDAIKFDIVNKNISHMPEWF